MFLVVFRLPLFCYQRKQTAHPFPPPAQKKTHPIRTIAGHLNFCRLPCVPVNACVCVYVCVVRVRLCAGSAIEREKNGRANNTRRRKDIPFSFHQLSYTTRTSIRAISNPLKYNKNKKWSHKTRKRKKFNGRPRTKNVPVYISIKSHKTH